MSGDPGARDMATSVKHIFLHRSFGAIATVEKSVGNIVEWCFRSTKRINVGLCYEHNIML